jgi:hypothetical protein
MVRHVLLSHRRRSAGLRLNFPSSGLRNLWSATDAEIMPQAEPGAMGQHLIMSAVRSRYIACAEWPYVRRFKHLLQLPDFVNDALDIHKHSIANPGLPPTTRPSVSPWQNQRKSNQKMATPKLTSDQITQVSGLLADYISTQRQKYAPRAIRLTPQQRVRVTALFASELLDNTRLLVLKGERVSNPEFYPMLRGLGFTGLPDQSTMAAITFCDVVVSHEPFSNGLLFHELVHVEQYRQLGIPALCGLVRSRISDCRQLRSVSPGSQCVHTGRSLPARIAPEILC